LLDDVQPFVEHQSRGLQGRTVIVSQSTANSGAVASRHFGDGVGPSFDAPLDGTHATDLLLQLLLCVTICFIERAHRFPKVVEVAQLVWRTRQRLGHSPSNGVLAIGDYAGNRNT